MATVPVPTRDGGYTVTVERGVLESLPERLRDRAPAHRHALIADDTVASLYGGDLVDRCRSGGLDVEMFTFPAGERSKTRKTWSILTDSMLAAGFGRDSCVVAVGGGVTTDLAGFVASTFLRGVPWVLVPTSYLAMIDASVGGKTGVDVRAGKNLVGAFHPPRLVVIDPEVLRTLPEAERRQGLVEAFKHGAILDRAYLSGLARDLEGLLEAEPEKAEEAVARSVRIKAAVVGKDERETGYRQILNFGHTLGHALEAASGFELGHGSAVANGMLLEAELGERAGVTEAGTRRALAAALAPLIPARTSGLSPDAVCGFLSVDKKGRSGRPRFVLLRRIGEVEPGENWSHDVSPDLVRSVLEDEGYPT